NNRIASSSQIFARAENSTLNVGTISSRRLFIVLWISSLRKPIILDLVSSGIPIPGKASEMNDVSQFQQVKQNGVDYYDTKEALISVTTLKHRNKRYTGYSNAEKQSSKRISNPRHRINRLRHSSDIALCPFKVCYMGRKRMRSRRFSRKIVG
ncbi:unnamed protein product, partial [Callosobruchus maculatus]